MFPDISEFSFITFKVYFWFKIKLLHNQSQDNVEEE